MGKYMGEGASIQNPVSWQEKFMAHLGITDEGEIVSLVDYEEREEFDERLLDLIKEGHYGRSI